MFGGVQLRAPVSSDYRPRRAGFSGGGLFFAFMALLSWLVAQMAGSAFGGKQKTRPGTYIDIAGLDEFRPGLVDGTVAAITRSSWGPLGQPTLIEGGANTARLFGSGGTLSVIAQAFRGNVRKVLAYRLGTGGALATVTLQDTAGVPVNVVRLDAKFVGVRANAFRLTTRDSLADAAQRELLVFEGTTLLETITYVPGAEEAASLVAAVNDANTGSDFLTGTRLAAGNNTVEDVSQEPLAGGADPVVVAADYTAAFDILRPEEWDVLVTDTEDTSIHASIEAEMDVSRDSGKRVMAVVAEDTAVAFATRRTNSKARNHPAVVYVANGFKIGDTVIEGADAGGRVAGLVASGELTNSLTHEVLPDATDLVGSLSGSDIELAIESGMLVFTKNALRQVQIEYGITTLTDVAAFPWMEGDQGWKKIRRVRSRDALLTDIARRMDRLSDINNDAAGRATVRLTIQGAINDYIALGVLDANGVNTVYEDPARPPVGDSSWWKLELKDLDSAEKFYLSAGFRFGSAA